MTLLALDALLENVSHWMWAVIGIGLVIFVHELGHFVVAKRFGVRCEVFSLGFGPRLFGVRRGGTDYRVSLVPIGGYVKMAGDNPGEHLEGDEGELPSKPIWQRFAIFSAGVAMNLAFALVTLPVVLAIGVKFHSTVVGGVQPGGPAWSAGLREGDEILAVDGEPVYDFNDIVAQVALGDPDGVELELRRNRQVHALEVVPQFDRALGRYEAGIHPTLEDTYDVVRGGPAEAAGMKKHHRIVSFQGQPVASFADLSRLLQENQSEAVELGLEGPDGTRTSVTVRPDRTEPTWLIGISPYLRQVGGVRGAAAQLPRFLRKGDEVLGLRVWGPEASFDSARELPVRDPEEFRQALQAADAPGLKAAFRVQRPGHARPLRVDLPDGDPRQIADDVALVQDLDSLRVRLLEGYPAQQAGLPEGAVILRVNEHKVADWLELRQRIAEGGRQPVDLRYLVDGEERTLQDVVPREERRLSDLGLLPSYAMVERRFGVLEAAQVGVAKAVYMIKNVYLTLKKMFARDVSPRNLSGILTIAVVSKSLAESGLPSLFFFLAVLSLNLAFINVLPIPVLDGGHLLFLLIEKVKGSPVSERAMGYSQLVGLVLVLALLLYVTYNDLLRLFATL